jgi:hypothetical protein
MVKYTFERHISLHDTYMISNCVKQGFAINILVYEITINVFKLKVLQLALSWTGNILDRILC